MLFAKGMSRSIQEDEYQRISKPQLFPQPCPSQPIPILLSPLHSDCQPLPHPPFLPAHISNCLQQTVWHLTEFHIKPENFCWKGPGSHRGFSPTQARILTQDLHSCLVHSLRAFPEHESCLDHKLSVGGQGQLHPPVSRSLGGQHKADHYEDPVKGPAASLPIQKELCLKRGSPSLLI